MLNILILLMLILITACNSVDSSNLTQAADYNVQLGLSYLHIGDTPRAKQKLLLALQQAPKWPVGLDAMAYYLESTGDNENADFYYKKALKYAPASGLALNNYGAFLCRMKHYAAAERYFLEAAKQTYYINTAEAYENAGLCALRMSNKRLAESYFSQAIKQDPRRSTGQYMLALLNYQQGKYEQARNYLQNYLKLKPVSAQSQGLARQIANKLGRVYRELDHE